ncbi:hypothetical protein BABINDRAFT_165098 [Babjeviella inositovora NRRL Y-12698]|uniref:Uncharacterized protein n=1 Tax=Babjeviella inositovora NRRL Y-12698 TaxID=984486 RepID=A0A1E3QV69_9ASCO|nr:uncharacterized protein BABINDRAFT_165098 [Babjeviella inositovora NRRL Y-12698]ODQ81556.1 hypothetical protein BABINDRAFT_165098 [Babjeviella inositovora NRRL Y-12698]
MFPTRMRRNIKACLFDMDGLLIDSEDKYTVAANIVLKTYNKGPMTWDIKIRLQGLPGPAANKIMLEAYGLPLTSEEFMAKSTIAQEQLWPTCKYMPGAIELLNYCQAKGIPFALASGSNTLNYERKTGHLQDGFSLFKHHRILGDDPRLVGRGKPKPDCWLLALASLNEEQAKQGKPEIKPEECLVFEDGIPGVEAGIAAGCYVIWVPDHRALGILNGKEKDIIGDRGEILSSLADFDVSKFGFYRRSDYAKPCCAVRTRSEGASIPDSGAWYLSIPRALPGMVTPWFASPRCSKPTNARIPSRNA